MKMRLGHGLKGWNTGKMIAFAWRVVDCVSISIERAILI